MNHPLDSPAPLPIEPVSVAPTTDGALPRWELVVELTRTRLRLWTRNRWLGFWWWLIEPLAMTAAYMLVLRGAFRSETPHIGLFLLAAVLPWTWFVAATNSAMASLTQHAAILKGARVRYAAFPLAEVLAATVRFAASLAIPLVLMLALGVPWTLQLLWLPLLIAAQLALTLGAGVWLAAAHVFAEDTANAWRIITRVGFFLGPSLYSVEQLPGYAAHALRLNPFTPIFTGYRQVLLRDAAPDVAGLLVVMLIGVGLLASGLRVLGRLEGWAPRIL